MRAYRKAALGALIAFVGALAVGASEGGISQGEWLTAALAGLTALAGIYGVPNAPPDTPPQG